MKTSTAFGLFLFGLVLTLGGVGGVEASVENVALLQSLAVSIVGMALMYCGVTALNVSSYYDEQ